MEKFILLWQIDWTKVPSNLRRSSCNVLIARVKYDLEKRINKEWNSFMGEAVGYVVAEGVPAAIGQIMEKYRSLVNFEIYRIASECMN